MIRGRAVPRRRRFRLYRMGIPSNGWSGTRLVATVAVLLIIALVVQVKFCKRRVEPEAARPRASQTPPPPGPKSDVTGTWEMSVQKRSGGAQTWTLTLEQSGEALKGVITSEGGDLPVSGTSGPGGHILGRRYGVRGFPFCRGGTMRERWRAHLNRQWSSSLISPSAGGRAHNNGGR